MLATAWLLTALLLLPIGDVTDDDLTDAQRQTLARVFGFESFQSYKIKTGLQQLRIADLNGDGRKDIAVWNSMENRIELFFQPNPDKPFAPKRQRDADRNEVPDRGNLHRENVPVAYRVSAMEIAELTGDKIPDIVFFGEPKELVVLPGKGDGTFGPADGIRAPEGEPRGGLLAAGDYNSDGRIDVALFGTDVLLVYLQMERGGLAKPIRIMHSVKNPLLMLAGDLNGDKRDDLLIGVDEDEYGAFVILQDNTGTLGAMQRVRVPRMRSMTLARSEGRGDDLYAVQYVTGRLKQYHWEIEENVAGGGDWSQLIYSYPLRVRGKLLPMAIGDINGDARTDIVTADPDAAQITLFRGGTNGLEPGVAFPGLVSTLDIAIADFDGDGKNELLSVSEKEKMIGISRFEEGRITFPTPLPIQGAPLAVAVGSRKPGETGGLFAYATRVEKAAELHIGTAGGADEVVAIGELKDDPTALRFADVNQDGRNDLLLFVRFGPMRAFLQGEDGKFTAFSGATTREGLVKDATLAGMAIDDVTGDGVPELILSQGNLARALRIKDGAWTVIDQYNPETADAQIEGIATLPGAAGSPRIAMYDRKAGELLVLERREDKAYAVAKTMPVGGFALTGMQSLNVSGSEAAELVLADPQRMLLVIPDQQSASFVEKNSFETDIKDAWLADAMVGDVNRDSIRDVVLIDVRRANLEILTELPSGKLAKAVHFQVFQGKRFSEEPDRGGEPHEGLIGDVTGDGIDDIVLLVHDRLIVYPGQ